MPAPHAITAVLARRTARRFLRRMLFLAVVAIGSPLALVVLLIVLFAADPETRCIAGLATPATDSMPVSPAAGLTPRQRELFSQPVQLRPGEWVTVGTTYYAAGDGTGTGTRGAIPDPTESDLTQRPDTFAELSLQTTNTGISFETANALGRLPWMTALRVRYRGRSIVVRKRDIGYGQGTQTIAGERYRIDLWGPAAQRLGTSSSLVQVQLVPPTGAGNTLAQTPDPARSGSPSDCTPAPTVGGRSSGPLPLVPGDRASLLPNGLAAAPEHAPAAIKQLIAAGNEIVGTPYVYGGGHGFSNSRIAPAYDCSSSITHLLYGAGLIDVGSTPASGELAASYGRPGYGEWVSLLANADHVYAYVAGLRWDTHRYGPGDGGVAGIGWHTAQRPDTGFTPRHPPGL